MAKLVVKPGANIWGLKIQVRQIFKAASKVWDEMGVKAVTVTSARDGVHGIDSFHPFGYAVDFRSWQWDDETAKQVAALLQKRLGDQFMVRYEPTIKNAKGEILRGAHIHAQYNAVSEE